MPTTDQSRRWPIVPFRFSPYDLACLDAVQTATGLRTRAEVIRQSLRALAQKEGVQLPDRKDFASIEKPGRNSGKSRKKA